MGSWNRELDLWIGWCLSVRVTMRRGWRVWLSIDFDWNHVDPTGIIGNHLGAPENHQQKLGFQPVKRSISNEVTIFQLIKSAQKQIFGDVYKHLTVTNSLPVQHPLSALSPFVGDDGIMRVGGKLSNSNLQFSIKHPILLPPRHNLTIMIFRFYHHKVKYQGSLITHKCHPPSWILHSTWL